MKHKYKTDSEIRLKYLNCHPELLQWLVKKYPKSSGTQIIFEGE